MTYEDFISSARAFMRRITFTDHYESTNGRIRGYLEAKGVEKAAQLPESEYERFLQFLDRVTRYPGNDLTAYYERQIDWSGTTFGPALRTKGICDHIRKELKEVEAKPHDLDEWVDIVILGMDGFWRHGGTAAEFLPRLEGKQGRNFARIWPDWRTMSEDKAIEHDRSSEDKAIEHDRSGEAPAADLKNLITDESVSISPKSPLPPFPALRSIWRHKNGNLYQVEEITNIESSRQEEYPTTVVYRNLHNVKVYSRALVRWYGSMTPVPDEASSEPGEHQVVLDAVDGCNSGESSD